ncbi:MAG: membrane protein insertase YidC [Nitrospirales bacterium]|nr:membrane protein insertase YidC [Nitrospira sp.]MDR4500905.1 membrane protein insertase YidC [Nitrospirales bacterium]
MEKRVVLFIILCLGIIIGWDLVLKQYGFVPVSDSVIIDQTEEAPSTNKKTGEEPELGTPEANTPDNSPDRSSVSSNEAPANDSQSQTTNAEVKIETIDTPLYRAEISNRGAQIKSWKLTRYLTQSDDPVPIELVYSEGQFAGPLSLSTDDDKVTQAAQEAIYEVERDFSVLDETHPVGHMSMTYQSAEHGVRIQKNFTFHHNSYVVDVTVNVEGVSHDLNVLLGTNFGIVEWGQGFIGSLGPAWMIGDKLEKASPEFDEGAEPGTKAYLEQTGNIRWGALQDKYFMSVIIPEKAEGYFAQEELEHVITAGVKFDGAQGPHSYTFRLYAGPKQFDILKDFHIGLEDTIDFGWFIYDNWSVVKAVAKPLFYVLRYFYEYTHNYGIAIILLTVCIKLLFVPLQYKSYKSMQGMQKIQPKVLEIQNKYKDDRERLNKELMKLYKDHKVNPVGGCLPMFLQMPAFISLFNILYMTVDLRQAPFMLWITDLSVPDPYYVLPILMGASMVLQQKIMPTTMDPTQAKMMLFLPVGLTFLFLTFPAGLVLYWVTNNVLTILQQFITDRYIFKKPTFSSPQSDGDPPNDSQDQKDKKSKDPQDPPKAPEKGKNRRKGRK